MATTSELQKNIVIRFKDGLCLVTEFQHVNPGKGSAFVRTRLKNIATGKVLENTFKSGESIEIVDVERRKMQYLYGTPEAGFNVMDMGNYEQVMLPAGLLGDDARFLKEGLEVTVLMHEGVPVTIELPRKIAFKVTSAGIGVKGDTASGNVTKEIELETGLKIQAPLFIKDGEMVIINTETGEYVERA